MIYLTPIFTGGDQQNEEVDQWNLRLRYRWQHAGDNFSDAGASLQWGRIYNTATGRDGDRRRQLPGDDHRGAGERGWRRQRSR